MVMIERESFVYQLTYKLVVDDRIGCGRMIEQLMFVYWFLFIYATCTSS